MIELYLFFFDSDLKPVSIYSFCCWKFESLNLKFMASVLITLFNLWSLWVKLILLIFSIIFFFLISNSIFWNFYLIVGSYIFLLWDWNYGSCVLIPNVHGLIVYCYWIFFKLCVYLENFAGWPWMTLFTFTCSSSWFYVWSGTWALFFDFSSGFY